MDHEQPFSSLSRRSFLQASTAASAALALRIVTEPLLAHAQLPSAPAGAVRINANENPLGPCSAAREAVATIIPVSTRPTATSARAALARRSCASESVPGTLQKSWAITSVPTNVSLRGPVLPRRWRCKQAPSEGPGRCDACLSCGLLLRYSQQCQIPGAC